MFQFAFREFVFWILVANSDG
jgi:cold shock protein